MAVGINKHPGILSNIGEHFWFQPVQSQNQPDTATPKQRKRRTGGDMDIEERMAKAETEIATLKQMQMELHPAMERGFAEQRTALADLRAAMVRGFAEQRQALDACMREEREARERAIAELRQEMQRASNRAHQS